MGKNSNFEQSKTHNIMENFYHRVRREHGVVKTTNKEKIYHRDLPQRFTTEIYHRDLPQRFTTEIYHRDLPQRFTTEHTEKKYTEYTEKK